MNFQDELRKNMRSSEEVNRENAEKLSEALMLEAKQTLSKIKEALINNVKNAKYLTENGITTVSCLCYISQRFLRRYSKSNSKELEESLLFRNSKVVYCTWECFEIESKYSNEYYQYLDILKKIADQENIKIEIVIHDVKDNKLYSFPIQLKRFYSIECYLSVSASTIIS